MAVDKIPDGVYAKYSFYAMRPHYTVLVYPNGNLECDCIDPRSENRKGDFITLAEGDTELVRLIDEIINAGFFDMKNGYYKANIRDGFNDVLTISKVGKTKSVSRSNEEGPDNYSEKVGRLRIIIHKHMDEKERE